MTPKQFSNTAMLSTVPVDRVVEYLKDLQQRITQALAAEEPSTNFREDLWDHASGGGGRSRVLLDGSVIEKAGVNFAHVWGQEMPAAATAAPRSGMGNAPFVATGVSVVIHPRNPYVPTSHFNVRLFVTQTESGQIKWWVGGGFDLTPYYAFAEDCRHFHQCAQMACQPFGADVYSNFKKAADQYFYLPHRQEARGIGGIFFDELCEWGFDDCFAFLRNVGDCFIQAYFPIVQRRKNTPYGKKEREFQAYRHGRYVEFNLLYDRGTLFGLRSGARTESILMSLPAEVIFRYDWQLAPGSEEAKLTEEFLPAQDWL